MVGASAREVSTPRHPPQQRSTNSADTILHTGTPGPIRIVKLTQTGESIPYPPFYEKLLATGSSIIPDPAHMTGMPFIDVVVFNDEPTPRAIFHMLVHVAQLSLIGPERVLEAYLRILNEQGLWAVVPFEEQAYQLDARYTGNPADWFSVEEEVREWLRSRRYYKE